jgi:hypothetical protein
VAPSTIPSAVVASTTSTTKWLRIRDGTPTFRSEWAIEHRYTFMLVADALALTVKSSRLGHPSFTQVTDAYSLADDVLTVHRQLTSINPEGQILAMQEPTNNFRHIFVYRRSP